MLLAALQQSSVRFINALWTDLVITLILAILKIFSSIDAISLHSVVHGLARGGIDLNITLLILNPNNFATVLIRVNIDTLIPPLINPSHIRLVPGALLRLAATAA